VDYLVENAIAVECFAGQRQEGLELIGSECGIEGETMHAWNYILKIHSENIFRLGKPYV